jgi:hypothetical protein
MLALSDAQLQSLIAVARTLPIERRAGMLRRFASLAELHRAQADQRDALHDVAVVDLMELPLSIDA